MNTMRYRKACLSLLGVIFCLMMAAGQVEAAQEFETKYLSTYQVSTTGLTTVRHKVELKNKVSNIYAEKFSMSVGFTDLKNILVKDGQDRITPQVETTDNQTIIGFDFINKVVGKNKANKFVVQYQTEDIASRNGAVWEVNIPKLQAEKGVSENSVTLIVPSEFGKPSYVTPRPSSETNRKAADNVSNVYEFSGSVLNRKAVSAVFGSVQFMKLDLDYHLYNQGRTVSQMQVALPPDTSQQTMIYERIEPEPINVHEDVDGNWLAVYRLEPEERVDIKVSAVAKINFFPKPSSINQAQSKEYLKSGPFWKTDLGEINTLGRKLDEPRPIYDYVVDYLNYDFEGIEEATGRQPMEQVLSSQLAICTGYSDLFISLARAAGIPSRELEGFALTENDKLRPLSLKKDVLHSWPEYYDEQKKTWVQIDPTWADTTGGVDYFKKLDLNHVVFVIHGKDAQEPVPAGGYKTDIEMDKDVRVKATEPKELPDSELKYSVIQVRNDELLIEVVNRGQTAFNGQVRFFDSGGHVDSRIEITGLPPWGVKKVQVPFKLDSKWKKVSINLKLAYEQKEQSEPVVLEPSFKGKVELALKATAVGGVLFAAAWWACRIFF